MLNLTLFLLIALIIALVVFILWFLGAIISMISGGPFVPSQKKNVADMIALASLKTGETVVDLGSGDGRLVFAAARTGAKAIGYEISPTAWAWSRFLQIIGRHGGVLKRTNLFKVSLQDADVVFCYLFPDTMAKLKPKLERELAPGARVVSNSFPVPGWPIVRQRGQALLQYRGLIFPGKSL